MKHILVVLVVALASCGGNRTPSETCTPATCPLGGHTYKFCSEAGATSCRYVASDGTIYACTSCSDCSDAASKVANWCSTASTTGSTTGTTGSTTSTTGTTGSTTSTTGTTGSTTSATGSTTSATGSTTGTTVNGCNGFAACLQACPDDPNNPGFYDPTCVMTCENNATDNALNLYFQATIGCAGKAFCTTAASGGGTIPCMPQDLDGSQDPSDACNTCIDNAYNTNQSGVQTACTSAINACTSDTP